MTGRACCIALLLLAVTPLLAYDMGDLPEWRMGSHLLGCALPPDTVIPETDQWPAAAWFEVQDTRFVIYAKHLAPAGPEDNPARFMVWISYPMQYREEIERERPFTDADAYAYLRRTGSTFMRAELYVGPGDRWGTCEGAVEWTAGKDRCVIGVFEAAMGGVAPKAFALHRIQFSNLPALRLGHMKCRCPRYDRGETREPGEEWIATSIHNQTRKVDQWGLPGNTPAPVAQPDPTPVPDPAPVAAPVAGLMDPAHVARFAGVWMEREQGLVLLVDDDGTWAMVNTEMPGSTPRAGTWGVVEGNLTLRTCLSARSQLWQEGLAERTAEQLTGGRYDLTMVYDLNRDGDNLVGACHSWQVTARPDGDIDTFMAWNNPGNRPSPVVLSHVYRVFPPIQDAAGNPTAPPELQRLLERIEETGVRTGPRYKRAIETFAAPGDAAGVR